MICDHPTHKIQDASKIQEYMQCPRKYFYRYVLGWAEEGANLHLEFGEAWHLAMESLLQFGYSKGSLELAALKLEQHYRKHFDPIMDESYYPKTPGFAREMLAKYAKKYADDFDKFEVLYTEISGTVTIDEHRSLAFKMDSILRHLSGPHAGKVFSLEHKTAKSCKGVWQDQWSLKMQVGVYTHVMRCIYGDGVYGIVMNGAQFQKTQPDFIRLPCPRTNIQMQMWYAQVMHWLNRIGHDFAVLREEEMSDIDVMTAFPLNTEACINYMRRCEYHSFCTAWPNPLRVCDQVPIGFEEVWWDPANKETTVKMNL